MCFSTSMFIIVSTSRKKYRLRGSKYEAFNKTKLNSEIKIFFKTVMSTTLKKIFFQLRWTT